MKILDLLFSGGVMGGVLTIAQGFFAEFQKDKESKRRLAEVAAVAASAEKKAAWDAFAVSQGQDSAGHGVSAWVNDIRALMRPILTVLLVGFVIYVYATATAELRAGLSDEITFAGFTAVFWWFGSRFAKK